MSLAASVLEHMIVCCSNLQQPPFLLPIAYKFFRWGCWVHKIKQWKLEKRKTICCLQTRQETVKYLSSTRSDCHQLQSWADVSIFHTRFGLRLRHQIIITSRWVLPGRKLEGRLNGSNCVSTSQPWSVKLLAVGDRWLWERGWGWSGMEEGWKTLSPSHGQTPPRIALSPSC